MKIGQDISIANCRCSAYIVIEYKGKDVKNGKLNKDALVHVTQSNPDNWSGSGRPNPPNSRIGNLYILDEWFSFNDLLVFLNYGNRREQVAQYAYWEKCQPNLDEPTPYDFINLAADIHAYFGLQTS